MKSSLNSNWSLFVGLIVMTFFVTLFFGMSLSKNRGLHYWLTLDGPLESSVSTVYLFTAKSQLLVELDGLSAACIQHFLENNSPEAIDLGRKLSRIEVIDYRVLYSFGKTQQRCKEISGRIIHDRQYSNNIEYLKNIKTKF